MAGGLGVGVGDVANSNLDVKTNVNVNLLASRSLQTLVEDEEYVSFLDLT